MIIRSIMALRGSPKTEREMKIPSQAVERGEGRVIIEIALDVKF